MVGTPHMVLLRGLPGSGKSYIARTQYPLYVHCSADNYLVDDAGHFHFNPSKLPIAHTLAQLCMLRAMRQGQCVVIDNTHCERWEAALYLEMAELFNYQLTIIDLFDAGHTDAELAARCIHGTPAATIANMRSRYDRRERA